MSIDEHPDGAPSRAYEAVPSQTRPPGREPSPWSVVVLVAAVLVVLGVMAWAAIALLLGVVRTEPEPDPELTELVQDPITTATFGSLPAMPAPTLPPAVVTPPADAAPATTDIVELYQRVFAPVESPELWDGNFTDATGLRELLRPITSGRCGVELQTVVTEVVFTSDDTANVMFGFDGPGIPDPGRGMQFRGGAVRQPGGAWAATPDAVQGVVQLAQGYC
jgi:hypothetical protein